MGVSLGPLAVAPRPLVLSCRRLVWSVFSAADQILHIRNGLAAMMTTVVALPPSRRATVCNTIDKIRKRKDHLRS